MATLKVWVGAARLRTLPLSIAGIFMGTGLAGFYGSVDPAIFILALLTTVCFQITSNFANDYGDGVKGTDNEERVGPKRALQSGAISRKALKNGILVSVMCSVILVIFLLCVSFGLDEWRNFIFFLALGGLSIWAAIRYTVGENAYGYSGLGDIFVFIFFGLVAVMGGMFLYLKQLPYLAILPAITIGLLSTGVLNLNNLRDHKSDKNANKNTVVVKNGYNWAKKYHIVILLTALVSFTIFTIVSYSDWTQLVCFLAFLPIIKHMHFVYLAKDEKLLDPELKKLALSTFLLSLLFCFCYVYFL